MNQLADPLRFGPHLDVAAGSATSAVPGSVLENQDNFLLIDTSGMACFMREQQVQRQQVPGWPPGQVRLAVLDGMGGHGNGREAAEATVVGLLEIPACSSPQELSGHLDALHARLQREFGESQPAARRPGTTLTMLEIPAARNAMLWHVGDSRLYEIKHGRAAPLTIDHVPATACAIEGSIDDMDWWQQVHGEHRSQISQAFILGNAFADTSRLNDPLYALTADKLPSFLGQLADRRPLQLDPDAVYILASDGFWACPSPQLWLARWPGLIHGPGDAAGMCQALFDEIAANPPSELHPDNITAIVVRPLRGADETALPAAAGEN